MQCNNLPIPIRQGQRLRHTRSLLVLDMIDDACPNVRIQAMQQRCPYTAADKMAVATTSCPPPPWSELLGRVIAHLPFPADLPWLVLPDGSLCTAFGNDHGSTAAPTSTAGPSPACHSPSESPVLAPQAHGSRATAPTTAATVSATRAFHMNS